MGGVSVLMATWSLHSGSQDGSQEEFRKVRLDDRWTLQACRQVLEALVRRGSHSTCQKNCLSYCVLNQLAFPRGLQGQPCNAVVKPGCYFCNRSPKTSQVVFKATVPRGGKNQPKLDFSHNVR